MLINHFRPRLQIHITAPNQQIEQDLLNIDVGIDTTLADLKGYVAAETNFDPSKQRFFYDGRPLEGDSSPLSSAGVKDGDLLAVLIVQDEGIAPRTNAATQSVQDDSTQEIERQRFALLSDPANVSRLRRLDPQLADVLNDPVQFHQKMQSQLQRQRDAEADRQRQIDILNEDPFNIEAQRKIEEIIRQHNVENNLQYAHDHNPESFATVSMLYINASINGHLIKVLVDSGAQLTIMSPACAEACNVMRLMDTRYQGLARGVGTAKFLGRVHSADLHIGNHFFPCSFMVMEGKTIDLLLGLDMLKKYQVSIDLKKNKLVLAEEEIDFLPESEIPKWADQEPSAPGLVPEATDAGPPSIRAPIDIPRVSAGAPGSSSGNGTGDGQMVGSGPATTTSQAPGEPRGQQSSSDHGHTREKVDQLVGLGMDKNQAIAALDATGGDVDLAASFLFE